jgi:hypothetical protein
MLWPQHMLADQIKSDPQCLGWMTFSFRYYSSKRSSTWPSASRLSLAGAQCNLPKGAVPIRSTGILHQRRLRKVAQPLRPNTARWTLECLFAAHKTRRSGVIVTTDRRLGQRWSWCGEIVENQTHRGSRFAIPSSTPQ